MANNTLTKTELEIMEYFWTTNHEITASDIREHFSEKKWSKQTISSFLKKLVNLGYIKRRKVSVTKFYYSVHITKEEYELLPARNIIKNIYNGSYRKFVCALLPNSISESELDELNKYLSEYKKKIEDNENQ